MFQHPGAALFNHVQMWLYVFPEQFFNLLTIGLQAGQVRSVPEKQLVWSTVAQDLGHPQRIFSRRYSQTGECVPGGVQGTLPDPKDGELLNPCPAYG